MFCDQNEELVNFTPEWTMVAFTSGRPAMTVNETAMQFKVVPYGCT
jgi:hypothetical protein